MFQKISLPKAKDAVIEQFEEMLLTGVLKANQKLPSERALAEQLEVSRPTVRDALAQLEARELLISDAQGTWVAALAQTHFAPALLRLFTKNSRAVRDYYAFRLEFDTTIAGEAALRATPADLARINEVIEQMEALQRGELDVEQETQVDMAFHLVLAEATHNVITIHVMNSIADVVKNGIMFSRSLYQEANGRQSLLDQHKAIARAVINGDEHGARRAAQLHIRYVQDEIQNGISSAMRESLAQRRPSPAKKQQQR